MDKIVVTGNGPLKGEIAISGAKNTCLKLMTAALLTDEPLILTNVPGLSDIKTLSTLLESLGCEVALLNGGKVMVLSAAQITNRANACRPWGRRFPGRARLRSPSKAWTACTAPPTRSSPTASSWAPS